MDYIGKWKLRAILSEIGDGFGLRPINEIIAECKDEDELRDLKQQQNTIIDINANGKVYVYMPIPDEMKSKSKEELKKLMKDEGIENPIITDTHFTTGDEALPWEKRGEALYVKTDAVGHTYDDDGNEVPLDPWEKWSDENSEFIHFFTAEYEKM